MESDTKIIYRYATVSSDGLGLALVRGFIQLHGGQRSARNTTVDNGATAVEFGFTLPVN